MKKLIIIVSSLLFLAGIIFYSCKKDVNNTNSQPIKNTINTTISLTNYDQIGINHNNGVEFLFGTSNFPDTSSFLKELISYYGSGNFDIGFYYNSLISNIPISPESEFNKMYTSGIISKVGVRDDFILMFNYFLNGDITTESGKTACYNNMNLLEVQIVSNGEFSNYEKLWLLGTASILRHSFTYWSDPSNQSKWHKYCIQTKVNIKAIVAAFADAIGYEAAYSFYMFSMGDDGTAEGAARFALTASTWVSVKVYIGFPFPS